MITELTNNPILAVVERLAFSAVVFVPLMIAVVQGVKQLTGLAGVKAQLAAVGINLTFGSAIALVYFIPGTAVYVGVGLFLLILAVAPLVGYITNFGHLHAPYFNLELEMNLWYLLRGAHVSLGVGYYFSRGRFEEEDFTATMYAIPLIASLGSRYHFIPRLSLAVSAGAGVHIIRNRGEGLYGFKSLETAAQLGVHGMATLGIRTGPGDIIVRAGYVYAKSTQIPSLYGHIGGLSLFLGFRYDFDI